MLTFMNSDNSPSELGTIEDDIRGGEEELKIADEGGGFFEAVQKTSTVYRGR